MLYSGETENNESEAQKIAKSFNNGIRGAFKVDLRICLHYKERLYDVCNVEFARNEDVEKKCVPDATKIAKLDDDDPKELQVLNLQFCGKFNLYKNSYRALQTFGLINTLISTLGLKGRIIGIRFQETGRGYVAENVDRTPRMLTRVDDITESFESVVAALLLVKECAEKNASLIEAGLSRDSNTFGSQSPKTNCNLSKTTWLGPKPSSPKVVPPPPSKFYLLKLFLF
ncbi:hypothetical protein INT48_000097 [Thamnidium elegans]|uniref:Uncharacterized protein n=1 Tax=Thamnidium elegans TaxID=101142 RepID=A0A8H7SV82_9FUNG|nr:hypothetical protein INT48_000097 [Thamnidium elegans]